MPLLGSFITEPAAMTLAALMLRDSFFPATDFEPPEIRDYRPAVQNISIGGTLTNFAAPPVLMVASSGSGTACTCSPTGWKAAFAVSPPTRPC